MCLDVREKETRESEGQRERNVSNVYKNTSPCNVSQECISCVDHLQPGRPEETARRAREAGERVKRDSQMLRLALFLMHFLFEFTHTHMCINSEQSGISSGERCRSAALSMTVHFFSGQIVLSQRKYTERFERVHCVTPSGGLTG